jgi:hypothetical protein
MGSEVSTTPVSHVQTFYFLSFCLPDLISSKALDSIRLDHSKCVCVQETKLNKEDEAEFEEKIQVVPILLLLALLVQKYKY